MVDAKRSGYSSRYESIGQRAGSRPRKPSRHISTNYSVPRHDYYCCCGSKRELVRRRLRTAPRESIAAHLELNVAFGAGHVESALERGDSVSGPGAVAAAELVALVDLSRQAKKGGRAASELRQGYGRRSGFSIGRSRIKSRK